MSPFGQKIGGKPNPGLSEAARHKTLSLLGSNEISRQINLQPDPLAGNLEL